MNVLATVLLLVLIIVAGLLLVPFHLKLEALLEDGTRVRGETKITANKGRIQELFLVPPDVEPLPQTLEAIARADVITIGPGSLFTSLIPNLLVRGVTKAILDSPAIKIYICNLMTQANESLGLTAADHIRAAGREPSEQEYRPHFAHRKPAHVVQVQRQERRGRRPPDRE